MKRDGTRAETRLLLSAKRTSPFKSAGASVQSTTGSRGVRISGSNTGYTMFRGSAKSTGYPLHSPVSPSLPLQCVTVCHHISTGLYSCKCDPGSRNEAVCYHVCLRHEYVLVLMVCRATGEVILSLSLCNGVQPKLKYSGVVSNWIAVLWERVKK